MRDNTVLATIEGDGLYVKTKSIFQYDRGLVLVINGITLPEEYDVHFSNTNSASTKTQKGNSNGVEIPDEYLRNGEDVHAYLYLHIGEDDGDVGADHGEFAVRPVGEVQQAVDQGIPGSQQRVDAADRDPRYNLLQKHGAISPKSFYKTRGRSMSSPIGNLSECFT